MTHTSPNPDTDTDGRPAPCMNCGVRAPLVWVHGHGQCSHCGMNTAPCCDGAPRDFSGPSGCGKDNA